MCLLGLVFLLYWNKKTSFLYVKDIWNLQKLNRNYAIVYLNLNCIVLVASQLCKTKSRNPFICRASIKNLKVSVPNPNFLKWCYCIQKNGMYKLSYRHLVRISKLWVQIFSCALKTWRKRDFCIKIMGTKLSFLKNTGCKISVLQNLWVQLHPLHPR